MNDQVWTLKNRSALHMVENYDKNFITGQLLKINTAGAGNHHNCIAKACCVAGGEGSYNSIKLYRISGHYMYDQQYVG